MRLNPPKLGHLTYCSNIHPGETWHEIFAQLAAHLPQLKARLSPDAPFGIGLRLSATAAGQLSAAGTLHRFQDWLQAQALYVFTINGFPYGRFHGSPVKEAVYRPDWRSWQRLAYSNRLADLLAALLPEGETGSISTLPGAYKGDLAQAGALESIAAGLLDHVAHLVRLREISGRIICLGLEPEPFCLLETEREVLDYFAQYLHSEAAARHLAKLTGLGQEGAAQALREHLGICLDACHASVQFEEPAATALAWRDAGVRIVKIQVSSALLLPQMGADARAALAAFDDPIYLHQTLCRDRDGNLTRFLDIPHALASAGDCAECRTHFHVPVFRRELGRFHSTQPQLQRLLELHRRCPLTQHLEVETYSFGVLPPEYRNDSLLDDIERELSWTRGRLET